MKTVLTFNSIASTTKYRLLDSGILNDNQSTDFAFLRLRGFYSTAAIFWHLPDIQKSAPRYAPEDVIGFLEKSPILVSDKSMSEMCGADPKELAATIKLLRKKPIKIPEDNLLYGLRGNFYKASDMIPVLDNLILSAKTTKIKIFSHDNRNENRFITGLNIQHPHGASGVDSARKLFANECRKLMLPAFQVKPLTYDTLDYDKLNWRKVMGHENFGLLKLLTTHPDNSFLLNYMGQDNPSKEFLTQIYAKAVVTYKSDNTCRTVDTTPNINTIEDKPQKTQKEPSDAVQVFDTIYQVVKHEIDEVNPFKHVDYAKALNTLRGPLYQYKSYRDEVVENIRLLKHFSQNGADNIPFIYVKPEDLHTFVVGDNSISVMVGGVQKRLVDVVNDYAKTFSSESLRAVDDVENSNKFFVCELRADFLPRDGVLKDGEEGLTAIVTMHRIVEALERLLKHIESITTIKTIKDAN